MRTHTITVQSTELGDRDLAPVPDGATNWESQEIRRAWREAVHATATIASAAARRNKDLIDLTPDAAANLRVDGISMFDQAVKDYLICTSALAARVQAVQHRLAIEKRENAS